MTWHCYQFEVNSIQRWVFGSGKLRAIVGGSRLVSGITEELLKAMLEALPEAEGPTRARLQACDWAARSASLSSCNKPYIANERTDPMIKHVHFSVPGSPCPKVETVDA